ncbi:FkbM family methyltransferase [Epilithonimonas xixisoli]|uniref:FkbM family methyltransferase n=1 Tax=Epilithonimonas xixisoli TaxID=1476462 RepID=A0A4R8IFV9_9FLAO|nr:FkbM family methyltransferase [Epilithonimonas xixisoli]TDX84620.1 FkbM family methyltransferase [Epilithonimonas xixisoli]
MLSREFKDKIKRKINYFKLIFSGETKHLKKEISISKKWFGNDYGGFFVATDFVDENSVVYSFGIGEDVSFDTEIIKKYNANVYGFDPTPKSVKWISEQTLPEKFRFYDFGMSDKTGMATFYFPKNPDFVSGSVVEQSNIDLENGIDVQLKTLDDTAHFLGHQKIDILKMDIEGSEYDVLENIVKSEIFIGQILIEFHDRFFENGKEKTLRVLKILKEKGFIIFGISETFDEVSFINKNLINK